MSTLEEKITELVEKVELQDSQIIALQNELKNVTKLVVNNVDVIDRKPVGNNPVFRTCHEINEANPSLGSGIHWIDPDGKGIGDDAISVYCNMTSGNFDVYISKNIYILSNVNFFYKGSTSILHDLSETKTDVGHCAERGCYSRKINYNATNRQIAALIGLSFECHQSITVFSHNLF